MRFFPDPLPPLVPHPLSLALSFSPTNYNFVYIIRNRILRPLSRDSLSRDFRSLRKRISAPLFPREIDLPTSAYSHLDSHFFSASESGRLARYYAGNRSSRVTRKRNISDIRRHCSSGISLSYFPPSSSFSPFLSLSHPKIRCVPMHLSLSAILLPHQEAHERTFDIQANTLSERKTGSIEHLPSITAPWIVASPRETIPVRGRALEIFHYFFGSEREGQHWPANVISKFSLNEKILPLVRALLRGIYSPAQI